MKKLIFTLTVFLLSVHSYSQNGIYMVTHVTATNSQSLQLIYDSVYVTDPSGSTIGYSIPFFTNIVAHDGAFNTILNNITSQGYVLMAFQPASYGYHDVVQGTAFNYTKYFLAEP